MQKENKSEIEKQSRHFIERSIHRGVVIKLASGSGEAADGSHFPGVGRVNVRLEVRVAHVLAEAGLLLLELSAALRRRILPRRHCPEAREQLNRVAFRARMHHHHHHHHKQGRTNTTLHIALLSVF